MVLRSQHMGRRVKPQPSTTHGAVRRLHRGVAPGNQGRRWLRPRSAGPGGRTLKYRSCGRIVRLAAPALRTTRSLSQASRHQRCPIATRRSDRPQPGGSGRSAASSSGLRWCWADIVESIAGAVRVRANDDTATCASNVHVLLQLLLAGLLPAGARARGRYRDVHRRQRSSRNPATAPSVFRLQLSSCTM